ncbi:diaminopimelate decarboxylase [Salinisphaera sp. P385]|uniref:Diaminopimelate decarboxylase n=1 Tax=Spectribacter acetivorans TaxID=3075603 RepID=A0ABU3B9I9_9GAMM|nr:diaminopimelate decarboxylase [Salinisphaera sp. P385]MDT0618843.1 diaminopimelate decarboxylase [Salinisphaera sp. P385]
MDHFQYRGDRLFAEDVDLGKIAARFGTPCYVYSAATLRRHYQVFDDALAGYPHLICYAVKANSNLGILGLLADLGSGFDIVSVGELERVLAAGGDPAKLVFSGVGKRADEMTRALEAGIRCFNIESESELQRLNRVAGDLGCKAPVSLRVNPDVDAGTHPYIATGLKENKFGIDIERAEAVYREAAALPHIDVVGADCHIGSQLTRLDPFRDAVSRMLALIDRLAGHGIAIRHLDVGGGLGITYRDETPPSPADYAAAVRELVADRDLELLVEPGRVLVGNAGILLTRVELLKPGEHKNFAIVDAAMNDLLRPALYDAWQAIVPVHKGASNNTRQWDVVGPVCETGDWLGRDRELSLAEGDLLAVRSAGAYGFAMASNYNSRPRPPELLVDGETVHEVRSRETIADLIRGEQTVASLKAALTAKGAKG